MRPFHLMTVSSFLFFFFFTLSSDLLSLSLSTHPWPCLLILVSSTTAISLSVSLVSASLSLLPLLSSILPLPTSIAPPSRYSSADLNVYSIFFICFILRESCDVVHCLISSSIFCSYIHSLFNNTGAVFDVMLRLLEPSTRYDFSPYIFYIYHTCM